MKIAFVELTSFSNAREAHFGGDENFRRLQIWLTINPSIAPVIPGTGGLRKVRWANTSRGIGKRSGFRVIYLFIEEVSVIVLFAVYSKNVATDLTPEQKRAATKAAHTVRDDFLNRQNASKRNEEQ